jgi:hypothetical protein
MKTSAHVVGPLPTHLREVFDRYCLVEQELLVGVRYSNKHAYSSGKCYFKPGGKIPHKITMVLGYQMQDHALVALHEIAHATGPHVKHDKAFWSTAIKYYEAEKIPKAYYYVREATYRTGFLEMAYQIAGDCPEYRLGYLARVYFNFMGIYRGEVCWNRDIKESVLAKELLGAGIFPTPPRRTATSGLGILNDLFMESTYEPVVFADEQEAHRVADMLKQVAKYGAARETTFQVARGVGGWGVRREG